jgi:hypothetical protein
MQYLKPQWAYWIADEYPNLIKSISDCQMIDIEDIDLYNQKNRARLKPVNDKDVKVNIVKDISGEILKGQRYR